MTRQSFSALLIATIAAGCSVPGSEPSAPVLAVAGAADTASGPLTVERALSAVLADASAFRQVEPGRFHATLGANLTATVDARGVAFDDKPLALRLTAFGRAARLDVSPVAPTPSDCLSPAMEGLECERRVELRRDGLVEWYRPARGGIEQGFEIAARPEGSGALELVLALDGAKHAAREVKDGKPAVAIADAAGESWRLDGLRAWDAGGAELPVDFAVVGGAVTVVVDDAGATYPITVDPTLTQPSSYTDPLNGDSSDVGTQFGYALAAGDVNGDGYDDLAISSPWWDAYYSGAWHKNTGRVNVLYGSSAGLQWKVTLKGDEQNSNFGQALAMIDLNGDGADDLVVGAPYEDAGGTNTGRVFLYWGVKGGTMSTTAATHKADNHNNYEYFGAALANAGDVNNDGKDDLIVGAQGWRYYDDILGGSYDRNGKVWVYPGAASFSWSAFYSKENVGSSWAGNGWSTALVHTQLGYSVAGVGDLNADGYDDIAVGEPYYGDDNRGRVHVIFGGKSSMSDDLQLQGSDNAGHMGSTVANLGSVNYCASSPCSTLTCIAGAAPDADANGLTDSGSFTVWCGVSKSGASKTFTYKGNNTSSHLGTAFAALGSGDFAVSNPGNASDSIWIMTDLSTGTVGMSVPASTFTSDGTPNCGQALVAANVKNDGYQELAVGCTGVAVSGHDSAGAVYVNRFTP